MIKKYLYLSAIGLLISGFPVTAKAATSIPLTVNLSETVVVTGTPRIAVDVGGNARYATYTSGSNSNALTFTLSPTVGDVDLDGVTVSSPIDLNGGTIKDVNGNNATLTFTPPNTSNVKVNYPSLGMDFIYDADGRYTLNGTVYNDLTSFLSAAGGSFTRNSVGTYFDSTGTLQTASANQPRFDYDPTTHAAKGILIEESRTNLRTNSNILDTWSMLSGIPSSIANSDTAPDGSLTADTLINAHASGDSYFFSTIATTSSSGTSFTFSVFLKTLSGTDAIAGWGGASGVTGGTQSCINLPNSWRRCSITGTSNTTNASAWPQILVRPSSSTLAWGAQLEAGSFATSYIPTTTAAVTRATDVLTVPTGGWFSNSAFTIAATANQDSLNNATAYPATWALNDGTFSNELQLYTYAGSGTKVSNVKGVQSSLTIYEKGIYTSSSLPNTIKSALAFGSSSFAGAANNGTVYSYSGSIPSGISSLQIGASRNGTANRINSSISKLKYYPLRASDTQLQLLTQ